MSRSHVFEQLRKRYFERRGQRFERCEPAVEHPAFELLVVAQRPAVIAHEVHLRHPALRPKGLESRPKALLDGEFPGHCRPDTGLRQVWTIRQT